MKYLKRLISKFSILLLFIILFVFISAKSYSKNIFNNISENFLRLHIVANSDSTCDQIIKYEIRDAVLEYTKPLFTSVNSKDEAVEILKNNIPQITEISNKVIKSHDLNHFVKVSVGNFYFPTKDYTKFTLPEGLYDALKIEIGNACGQNWWCVMFPSLCIMDTSDSSFFNQSETLLKQNLPPEEYNLITNKNQSVDLKIKFKLVEFFENI